MHCVQVQTGKCWSKTQKDFVDFDPENPTADLCLYETPDGMNDPPHSNTFSNLREWIKNNGMSVNQFCHTVVFNRHIKVALKLRKMTTATRMYGRNLHVPEVLYMDDQYAAEYRARILNYPFVIIPDFTQNANSMIEVNNVKHILTECIELGVAKPILLLSKTVTAQKPNSQASNYLWGVKSEKDAIIFKLKGLPVIKPEDLLKVD